MDNHPDTPPPHIGDHKKAEDPSDTSDGSGSSSTGTIPRNVGGGYTSTQPLPDFTGIPDFPSPSSGETSPYPGSAPVPYPWQPKYLPEQWVYTDGSDIEGHPRLGAAVVHNPTATTIYIDAAGSEETRTIMRAELVAIYTALKTFASHEWIGVFTDSLTNMHAIQHHHTNPGTTH